MKWNSIQGKPRKVIILGGGFAGLTTAAYLVNSGFKVEVIETSGKLGGRAYSFLDKESNTIIDNGQHILMGCYNETLNFLKLIGAEDKFIFQENLKVHFVKEGFELFPFKASSAFYPLNLYSGLINYKAISLRERFLLLKIFLKLPLYSSNDLAKMSIEEWLNSEGQTEKNKKAFWEIVAVGALNTNIRSASAKIFVDILKQMFLKGNKAATIILPGNGLTESYCIDAKNYIEVNWGKINFHETVQSVESNRTKITAIHTSEREIKDFDFVISALPPYALQKIMPGTNTFSFPNLNYSAILSIHIWLRENKLEESFYGLINSPVHWVFNHDRHITLVISDANHLVEKSKEEIFELVSCELKKFMRIDRNEILSYKIIKEKRATFIPSNDILKQRLPAETQFSNFFLAGDWVDTGLPSTIESAVKSGRMAAKKITGLF